MHFCDQAQHCTPHIERGKSCYKHIYYSLSKHRVELFGNVVLFVFDLCLSQSDRNVRVSFAINVGWMQLSRLRKTLNH